VRTSGARSASPHRHTSCRHGHPVRARQLTRSRWHLGDHAGGDAGGGRANTASGQGACSRQVRRSLGLGRAFCRPNRRRPEHRTRSFGFERGRWEGNPGDLRAGSVVGSWWRHRLLVDVIRPPLQWWLLRGPVESMATSARQPEHLLLSRGRAFFAPLRCGGASLIPVASAAASGSVFGRVHDGLPTVSSLRRRGRRLPEGHTCGDPKAPW